MSTPSQVNEAMAPMLSFSPGFSGLLHRKCACGGTPGPKSQCEECRKKYDSGMLQPKRAHSHSSSLTPRLSSVPPIVHDVLNSPGQPLDSETRAFMEPRFGHDFSRVRVHFDGRSAESAQAVNALAYTVGRDVVFDAGQYAPGTHEGKRLLAHELSHVVQQMNAGPGSNLTMTHRDDTSEMEARSAASHVTTDLANTKPLRDLSSSPIALARGEKWDAFWGVGPWDAYKAKKLAEKALSEAERTGLPGLGNGPADAWRHCYWNCTMTGEIGAGQAKFVADNHEKHGGGPANQNTMDYHNNDKGRSCGGKNCDTCCQTKLDSGELRIVDATGAVVPSGPTIRPTTPASGSGGYKY